MQITGSNISFARSNIEVKSSPIVGRGVFAAEDIFPDETIEECPVIVLPEPIARQSEELRKHLFFWDDRRRAIALGYGSIYNHSDNPNAEVYVDFDNGVLNFVASEPISRGAEILIDYNYEKNSFSSTESEAQERLRNQNKEHDRAATKLLIFFFSLLILTILFPIHVS